MRPILSICIPTYQRCERIVRLVEAILAVEGAFEVCVHVDGSNDGSREALNAIAERDERLLVNHGANQGRAKSIRAAFELSKGEFVMFYDDDDELFPTGLLHVLQRLRDPLDEGACGYVFNMSEPNGGVRGAPLPARSNFLRLRADDSVEGDKKEVVRRDLLQANFYVVRGSERRVPTSTLWSRLALRYDVVGDNTTIGAKDYLEGGYTDRISRLKAENPRPMVVVNAYRVAGFLLRRYHSPRYFMRAIGGLCVYGLRLFQLAVASSLRAPGRGRGSGS